MKLTVERVEGQTQELCLHADGEILPAQQSVRVVQEPGEITKVEVTFHAMGPKWPDSVEIRGGFGE